MKCSFYWIDVAKTIPTFMMIRWFFICQRILDISHSADEVQLTASEFLRMPLINENLLSMTANCYDRLEHVLKKVPNLRSLKVSSRRCLNLSFFQSLSKLEIFHLTVDYGVLSDTNAGWFSHLQMLIEIDLGNCNLPSEAMRTALESFPETLRRFRHRYPASMEHFSIVVHRFPKLEEFTVNARLGDTVTVCSALNHTPTPRGRGRGGCVVGILRFWHLGLGGGYFEML